ncbi:hypothetical protein HID58_083058, partial [Brassica napus]
LLFYSIYKLYFFFGSATLVRGFNFTRLRLHGRIEGNVNKLCDQLKKSSPIKIESGNSNTKKRRSDYDSLMRLLLPSKDSVDKTKTFGEANSRFRFMRLAWDKEQEFAYKDFDVRLCLNLLSGERKEPCAMSRTKALAIVVCDTTYNNGCNSGFMDYAFECGEERIRKEEDYPYSMEEGTF